MLDTATATEQAKMLIKSGAISAIKSENKNSGFKRSRTLEIKLKVRYNMQYVRMCNVVVGIDHRINYLYNEYTLICIKLKGANAS